MSSNGRKSLKKADKRKNRFLVVSAIGLVLAGLVILTVLMTRGAGQSAPTEVPQEQGETERCYTVRENEEFEFRSSDGAVIDLTVTKIYVEEDGIDIADILERLYVDDRIPGQYLGYWFHIGRVAAIDEVNKKVTICLWEDWEQIEAPSWADRPADAPAEPTVAPTIVPTEDSRIMEQPDGLTELTVEAGQSFLYWNVLEQKWVEYTVVSVTPDLVMRLPLNQVLAPDESYLDSEHWVVVEPGPLVLQHFWIEIVDADTVVISAGQFRRLKAVSAEQ